MYIPDGCGVFGGRRREDYGKDKAQLRPSILDKLCLSGVWNSLGTVFQSITVPSVLAFQSLPTALAILVICASEFQVQL